MTQHTSIPIVKVGLPPRDMLMPALEKILYSGFIAEGEAVYQFEKAFAEQFGLPRALGMSSGTAALHVALLLAGAGPDREVITTAMTAEPTNIAILQTGAIPVFADVDPHSGNIDPRSVESLITSRTTAIVVVHYAGFPVRMQEILDISRRHNIPVIEDCAHALGASYGGQAIGSLADYGLFSFQAIKHMTTIDGGVLTMRSADLATIARKLRWFGLEKGVARTEVDIQTAGYKYNMNNVTATIGLVQLQVIEELIDRHRGNGQYFDKEISAIAGLEVTRFDEAAKPSYWLYTVLSEDSANVERRLAEVGVTASKLHRPNHLHSVFAPFRRPLPGLDSYYRRMVHIPCGWWVSDDDRERIVDALKKG